MNTIKITAPLLAILTLLQDTEALRGIGTRGLQSQSGGNMSSSVRAAGRGGAGGVSKGFSATTRQMMGVSPEVPIDVPNTVPGDDDPPVPVTEEEDVVGGGDLVMVDRFSGVTEREVVYEVTFENLWTSVDHPNDYPIGAHWSPPVLVSHNTDYEMWRSGGMASAGVQIIAETGSTSELFQELDAAEQMSLADTVRGSIQFNSNQQSQTLSMVLDAEHSLVSTITMVAPSPDWFSGFYNVQPSTDGEWWQTFVIETYPWDAGTDGGSTYMTSNDPTVPQEGIFEITADTSPLESQVFVKDGRVLPVARWTFSMQV